MIGQNKLKNRIDEWYSNKSFPRFCILEGSHGSGKKTLCQYIAKKFNMPIVLVDNKVDCVRNTISMAYTQCQPILYCVLNCQDMSVNAKNSLLKICEEPCEHAYIILMTTDNNLLDTLKSRATTIKIQPYSYEEKLQFIHTLDKVLSNDDINYIVNVCNNLGQIKVLTDNYNINDFKNFVQKVYENIDGVSIGNALKICNNLKIKTDSNGYDITLFLQALSYIICTQNIYSVDSVHSGYIKLIKINKCLNELKNSSYSTQSTIDDLILSIKGL